MVLELTIASLRIPKLHNTKKKNYLGVDIWYLLYRGGGGGGALAADQT